jgi:hypothetical protein
MTTFVMVSGIFCYLLGGNFENIFLLLTQGGTGISIVLGGLARSCSNTLSLRFFSPFRH